MLSTLPRVFERSIVFTRRDSLSRCSPHRRRQQRISSVRCAGGNAHQNGGHGDGIFRSPRHADHAIFAVFTGRNSADQRTLSRPGVRDSAEVSHRSLTGRVGARRRPTSLACQAEDAHEITYLGSCP